jgi:lysophospholipase L1-like esterase
VLSQMWKAGFIAVAATVMTGAAIAPVAAQPAAAPTSMASLGDSITRGFNACGWLFDCTDRSWSTGASSKVESHYWRIRSTEPGIDGNNFNNAHNGADSADLTKQAEAAVAQKAQYVTILIGANDACGDSEAAMTTPEKYRSNVDAGLAVLKEGLPEADVFVASVPDVVRLWQIGHDSVDARNTWNLAGICKSVLANPASVDAADTDRRDRVATRIDEYNAQLESACQDYGAHCRYDGGAVHNFEFTLDEISHWDFFHPNKQGQRALAEVTYKAGFGW